MTSPKKIKLKIPAAKKLSTPLAKTKLSVKPKRASKKVVRVSSGSVAKKVISKKKITRDWVIKKVPTNLKAPINKNRAFYYLKENILAQQISFPINKIANKAKVFAAVALSLILVVTLLRTTSFVNADASQGTINVTTVVTNDDGGTKTASDFTINVSATNPSPASFPGDSGAVPVTVDPGSYSITGSADPAYTSFVFSTCSGTISAGQSVNCKIFYNDITPKLNVITHIDNTSGGTKSAGDFTMNITGTSVSNPSFTGSESGNMVSLSAGSYSVDQAADLGYTKNLSSGCSGTINVGESKTCTITDVFPSGSTSTSATIIVKQMVTNDDGGSALPGDFTELASGTNISLTSFPGSSATTLTVDAGSYAITQSPTTSYSSFIFPNCAGTIVAGQTVTCKIVSNDVTPQLMVINHVVNSNGGTNAAGDFTINVTGTSVSNPSFPGSESGSMLSLSAGSYSVDEASNLGYNKALSADCSGTIGVGQSKTCTITNSDVPIAPSSADIAVMDSVSNSTPSIGDTLTYTLTVTNNGAADATNVVATDTLPGSLTFASSTPSQGAYDSNSGVWTVGSLAANASATLNIEATVNAGNEGQTINNSVVAGADQTDPNSANNSASANVTVNFAAPVLSQITSPASDSGSITITWTTDHAATSRVIYDTISHSTLDVAPNYGYANSTLEDSTLVTSHSVTVTGLIAGTTYFLRPVSHGSPEAVGTEVSVTTDTSAGSGGGGGGSSGSGGGGGSGIVIGTATPVNNNVTTPPTGLAFDPNAQGQILGASTNVPSSDPSALPKTGVPAEGLLLLVLAAAAVGAARYKYYQI